MIVIKLLSGALCPENAFCKDTEIDPFYECVCNNGYEGNDTTN